MWLEISNFDFYQIFYQISNLLRTEGKITRKEPAPRGSRKNKNGIDPGTLIEQISIKYDNYNSAAMSSTDKYVFLIRRIGEIIICSF
jgi:hypothetical protein